MQRIPRRSFRASDDPAVLTAQLLLRMGFGVLAIAVPVTAAFSRRALFVLLPLGAVLILIAAALAPSSRGGRRLIQALWSPAGIAAMLLAVWAALSLFWTPYLPEATQRLFKLASTLVLATLAVAFLPERMRLSSLYLLPIGLALAAVMTLGLALVGRTGVAGNTEVESFTLNRAGVMLVILVWPALHALLSRDRLGSAGALAAIVAAAAIATRTPVAVLGLAIGALAFAAIRLRPRRTARILAVGSVALFVLAPLLPACLIALATAVHGSVPEWLRPVAVAADVVRAHRARLLAGHGLESMLRDVAAGVLPPSSPRSILFVAWYELGWPGAAAMAVVVGRAFWAAGRAGAEVAPFLTAALACALTLAVIDQNVAQLWWVALLGVAAIEFAAVIHGQYRTDRPVAQPVSEAPRLRSAF